MSLCTAAAWALGVISAVGVLGIGLIYALYRLEEWISE